MPTYSDTPNYGKGAPALLFVQQAGVWREGTPTDFKAVKATVSIQTNFTSTVSAVILASDSLRIGATIYNEGAGTLHVLLGTGTASTTNYSVKLLSGAYYELPYGYTGQVTGIFSSAGTARVTDLD